METSLNTLNNYFSILEKTGYIDDNTVLSILIYIALQEIRYSWEWDEKYISIISNIMNSLESEVCIISNNTPCINKGTKDYNIGENTFGFYDLPQVTGNLAVINELVEAIKNYNLFATL